MYNIYVCRRRLFVAEGASFLLLLADTLIDCAMKLASAPPACLQTTKALVNVLVRVLHDPEQYCLPDVPRGGHPEIIAALLHEHHHHHFFILRRGGGGGGGATASIEGDVHVIYHVI